MSVFNIFSFLLPKWVKDQHPGSRSLAYRRDIDGLRAIAILSVVAYHAGINKISGGYVGVDVFFVISGYLIIGLLFKEIQTKGSINLLEFYARRVRRLLPALVTVVVTTLALSVIFIFPMELPRLGKSALALMLAASNFHFRRYSGGYFDPSADIMPLLHTWSLSVEEQFYLTWPTLLILLGWLANRIRVFTLERLFFFTLLSILIISFAACYWYTYSDQSAAFYLMPFRAWEFALGGLVGLAQQRFPLSPRSGAVIAGWGLATIITAVLFLGENVRFPGWAVLPPTLGTAMVIYGLAFSNKSALASRILTAKPMVEIGLLSYSWYLWHWALLALTRDYYLGARDTLRDSAVVLIALFLSWLTYWLIENPIRYRKPWVFKKALGTLAAGVVMSFLTMLLAEGVIGWGRDANTQLNVKLLERGQNPFGKGKCKQTKDGRSLAPLDECTLGKPGGPVKLLLWGDSHAGQYTNAPTLSDFVTRADGRILVRNWGACPPILGAIPYTKDEGQFSCGHFNENVVEEIRRITPSGLRGVILSSRWNSYLSMPDTNTGSIASLALVTNWHAMEPQKTSDLKVGVSPLDLVGSTSTMAQSLRANLRELSQLGLRVLLIAPNPELPFNGPQCLYRKSEVECVVSRSKVDERRAPAMQVLNTVAAEFDNVRLVDPIDQFCDNRLCYAKRDGLVMYHDDNHLPPAMTQKLLTSMQPQMEWLIQER